jgi:hypothetical protein
LITNRLRSPPCGRGVSWVPILDSAGHCGRFCFTARARGFWLAPRVHARLVSERSVICPRSVRRTNEPTSPNRSPHPRRGRRGLSAGRQAETRRRTKKSSSSAVEPELVDPPQEPATGRRDDRQVALSSRIERDRSGLGNRAPNPSARAVG